MQRQCNDKRDSIRGSRELKFSITFLVYHLISRIFLRSVRFTCARFFDFISERNISKIYLDVVAACANRFFSSSLSDQLTFSLRDKENMVHYMEKYTEELSKCNLSSNSECTIYYERLNLSRWPCRFRNHYRIQGIFLDGKWFAHFIHLIQTFEWLWEIWTKFSHWWKCSVIDCLHPWKCLI